MEKSKIVIGDIYVCTDMDAENNVDTQIHKRNAKIIEIKESWSVTSYYIDFDEFEMLQELRQLKKAEAILSNLRDLKMYSGPKRQGDLYVDKESVQSLESFYNNNKNNSETKDSKLMLQR